MRNETGGNHIATVVVRASTDNIADDIERAIEDGVNAYKVRAPPAMLLTACFSFFLCHRRELHFLPPWLHPTFRVVGVSILSRTGIKFSGKTSRCLFEGLKQAPSAARMK